jgi:dihydroorotate dehydrogenase electron transfer subunit
MSEKKRIDARIVARTEVTTDIYSYLLEAPEAAAQAKAGQFINVYCKDKSRLLPRPISICEIEKEKGQLRIVFRINGEGTKELATYGEGESLAIVGPLGNGFPVEEANGKRAVLFGGGIGIFPMLETAKSISGDKTVILGYRNDDLFVSEEFEEKAGTKAVIATDDGSAGTKGNVLDAYAASGICADVIYACGPMPMLRAVKAYALEHDIAAYVSLEERMACGIGACLACVCQSSQTDVHTNVNNKRICKEGPVFEVREVKL